LGDEKAKGREGEKDEGYEEESNADANGKAKKLKQSNTEV